MEEFKKLFRDADFQSLIKMGAPPDEYDHEAVFLYNKIVSTDSVADIQKKIWDHFYDSFCTSYKLDDDIPIYDSNSKAVRIIGTVDNYKEIAEQIKKLIGN
jgi:hypothetical protein